MGVVVVSVDAELAWGFHDLPNPPDDRIAGARDGWIRLLELMDEHDIPATWAVVGHLFLDECDGTHADHPRREGWFDCAGSSGSSRRWHGADLVDATLSADVTHEIACHTFSHVLFGRSETSRETATAEMRRCLDLAEAWGIDMESFVFPRNDVGHRDVIADHGFTCYRGRRPGSWYRGSTVEPFVNATGGRIARNAPPVVTPYVDDAGLVNIPASLFLFVFEGLARNLVATVWRDPVVEMAKLAVDRVADTDGVFHMWLHPNNLTEGYTYERVDAILSYVAETRRHSDLDVLPMGDLARTVREERDDGPSHRPADGSRRARSGSAFPRNTHNRWR